MAFLAANPLLSRTRNSGARVQGRRRYPTVVASSRKGVPAQSPGSLSTPSSSSPLRSAGTQRCKLKTRAKERSAQSVEDLFVNDVENVVAGFARTPAARHLSPVATPRLPRRRVVDVEAPTRPRLTTGRKPNGYWNELSNVEAALVEVNSQIPGRAGKRIMPTTSHLRDLGRLDLLAALSKHKGMKRVAEVLGWTCSRRKASSVSLNSRNRSNPPSGDSSSSTTMTIPTSPVQKSDLRTSSRNVTRLSSLAVNCMHSPSLQSSTHDSSRNNGISAMRSKVMRRPKSYWDDIAAVKSSISAFILEYGTPGVMPTEREFANANQSALRLAAQRHGGLAVVAEQMGLKFRKAPRRRNNWKNFDTFSRALLDFTREHDAGVMPTASELKAAGENPLCNAITFHGGFPAVARRLGLIVRNARREGAPETWDESRLSNQLRTFTATFFPALALSNCLPSEAQLRKCGRNDLCYAISKFGGYKHVQEHLGFAPRPVGPRSVV